MPLRLKTLRLSWFRGAGAELVLDTGGKSVAIYGPNGAGKSSLIDALECVLAGGKVGHLAMEESGRRQENAIPNTHAPGQAPSIATVTLCDGRRSSVTLGGSGMPRVEGAEHVASWNPNRSILRQGSVTGFITSSKGDKYKALLPLLGLGPLETAASNLRAVALEITRQTQFELKEGEHAAVRTRRQAAFPGMDGAAISDSIKALVSSYLPGAPLPTSLQEALDILTPELKRRIDGLDEENTLHVAYHRIRDAGLDRCLAISAEATATAASASQPLLSERLAILRASGAYTAALVQSGVHDTVECPACGQQIEADYLVAHVRHEEGLLTSALGLFDRLAQANSATAAALTTVQGVLSSKVMDDLWRTTGWAALQPYRQGLLAIDPDSIKVDATGASLMELPALVAAVLLGVEAAAANSPPSTQKLVKDRDAVLAAADWQAGSALRREIADTRRLIDFLKEVEAAVRDEIRQQSGSVITEISDDVAAMWKVLHPEEPIDGVALYQHSDTDKAIDLKLRFHGKDIASPRLTLSEGHRNSLGLCVFLALARRGQEPSPIILDDVVTSFDREHRASVTDLLLEHMHGLQLIVLTHEYDWFIDLSNRLPPKGWSFQQLRPFAEPAIGIQWGGPPSGFEPARALLDQDASAAANKARGLLDVHLAVISERLRISMPFIRGPRNELRHADDMLQRFATKAASAFRRRSPDGKHEGFPEGQQAAEQLKQLLVPFANPPSHGRIVPRAEAERLITAGERFRAVLVCAGCDHPVTRGEVGGKHMECECGTLRWTF